MEETKTKGDLKITTEDLKGLQRQQNRHYGDMWEPGSVLDRFEDALHQLPENERKILKLYHVENKTFIQITGEILLPPTYSEEVENIYNQSMKKLTEKLGLSEEDKISLLFNFKDLQQKTLKVINVLSL